MNPITENKMSETKNTHPTESANAAGGESFEDVTKEIDSMRELLAKQQRPAKLDSATLNLWEELAIGLKADLEQRTLSKKYKELINFKHGQEVGTYIGMDIDFGPAWEIFMRILKEFRKGLSVEETERYTWGVRRHGRPIVCALKSFARRFAIARPKRITKWLR